MKEELIHNLWIYIFLGLLWNVLELLYLIVASSHHHNMRALSIFLVTGPLLATSVLCAPAQPTAKVVEKTPKAHPPYSGGVVVLQDDYQSDDGITYPDDESDSDDDYEVVVEQEK